jgi:hypothetical protein
MYVAAGLCIICLSPAAQLILHKGKTIALVVPVLNKEQGTLPGQHNAVLLIAMRNVTQMG